MPQEASGLVDRWLCLVVAAAGCLAWWSARDYAGGWNDGSRLATVECLVDHHTWAIDESIFVDVRRAAVNPYCVENDDFAFRAGTQDKLRIGAHYYSDKSPVPAVLMAAAYKAWQWAGGDPAARQTGQFCFVMTLVTAGLSFVVSCGCVYVIGAVAGLRTGVRLVLTASFALATVALPYARHVNNHILLLAVVSLLVVPLVRWSVHGPIIPSGLTLSWCGFWGGLAYTIDLGAGPVLLIALLLVVGWNTRSFRTSAVTALAALPWVILHHALNYEIGRTIAPANSTPEYLCWPGSPFNQSNMTGGWHHPNMWHFLEYALALLLGKRGFIGHNLELFVAVPATLSLAARARSRSPVVLFALFWCGGTWLLYAAASTNGAGQSCSIRWFVPFLAPAYGILAVALARWPERLIDLIVLSAWGGVLTALMWRAGPWMAHLVPGFWPTQAAALLNWAWICRRRQQRSRAALPVQPASPGALSPAA